MANPCDAERALMRHVLEECGFVVLEARGAKDVVDTCVSHPPHLVLLDNVGWEESCLATLSALKSQPQTCRIPVMIFGQAQSREQVTDAARKGAATWIGRQGFNLARFLERIGQVLEQSDRALRIAPPPADVGPSPAQAKISHESIDELLRVSAPLSAFEFSLVQAMTTHVAKDQTCSHLTEIAQRDPCLTLALLDQGHLAAGDGGGLVTDTAQAVARLGPRASYQVIEAVPSLKLNLASLWDAGCWWGHSVATSRIAELLSRQLGLGVPAVVANAGLLQDLGEFLLATSLPQYYGRLVTAAGAEGSVHPGWEREIVGAHHGELTAWILRSRGLPDVFSDAALTHHGAGSQGQVLTASSRLVVMIVQAADALARALFPADPPLAGITTFSAEFEGVLRDSNVNPESIVDASRKLVAELLTELAYRFPQTATRSFFHEHEPFERLAYLAYGDSPIDVVRLYLQVRSRELLVLDRRALRSVPSNAPMVINLTRLEDPSAQVEFLTSLMAARALENRRGVVLLPATMPDRLARDLVPSSWRLVCRPAQGSRLVRFLMGDDLADQPQTLCVA